MKRILIISLWVVLVAGLAVSLGFVGKAHDQTICSSLDIRIKYKSDDFFLTSEDVLGYFTSKGIKIKGQPLSEIDPEAIESALKTNPYIENAEVYVELNANVKIVITQKMPLARVVNKFDQSFYIDDQGALIPLNPKYSARVVVANGFINEFYVPSLNLNIKDSEGADSVIANTSLYKIYKIASYINKDEFWKAQIEEIFIDSKGEIELYCKVGDFKVLFGDIDNLDIKFQNLFYFFKNGLNKIGWSKYSTVNVKFKNQVVCSKL